MVNCIRTKTSYSLVQTFTSEDVVPQNWYVSNGRLKRIGGGLPYTSGCRILHFTNSQRGFEYGLLVQNPGGKEKSAWAKFGDKTGRSSMTLHAGHYVIKSRLCNWDQPEFTSAIYTIENLNGEEVASEVFTPTVNIGGNTANKFSNGKGQTFEFDIPETGDYVFTIYTDAVKNADFVLCMATLQAKEFYETGIKDIDRLQETKSCYDLSGRRLSKESLKPGLYIIGGRKVMVK
jgi:hypothetical protein